MSRIRHPHVGFRGLRLRAVMPMLLASAALGGTVAGCGTGGGAAPTTAGAGAVAVEATVPLGDMHRPTAHQMDTTWSARPDYVRNLPADWQEAYKFALVRPDVLQWLPCYCGCGGMGHGNNLDCFFQRREEEGNFTYEEHASYCDICVKTANLASQMLRDGSTMVEIRDAVDAKYGGGEVPGTDTPLPPSA